MPPKIFQREEPNNSFDPKRSGRDGAAVLPASPCLDLKDTQSMLFIPEEHTPLFHTDEYRRLPEAVRLRYNKLHALYFNEQVIFFEQEMLSPTLRALDRLALPRGLAAGVRQFHAEEQRHTAMFRSLNRSWEPELYGRSDYFFVRVSATAKSVIRAISRHPRLFPLLLWLALLQEERSLYYSKACLEHGDRVEPEFVAVHRAHLADEVGHIAWDEQLLDWLWPRTPRIVRAANAQLFIWLVREFFLFPKRSGVRVVERLTREFPRLDGAGLRRAMAGLDTNVDYGRSLYSREVSPRTFARFDRHPDFTLIARKLPGYVRLRP